MVSYGNGQADLAGNGGPDLVVRVATGAVGALVGAAATAGVLTAQEATSAEAVVVGAAVGISAAVTCVWCCSR